MAPAIIRGGIRYEIAFDPLDAPKLSLLDGDQSAGDDLADAVTPGDFLVVFASGKDRSDPTAELHTNFSLGTTDDFLAVIFAGSTAAKPAWVALVTTYTWLTVVSARCEASSDSSCSRTRP